MDTQVRFARSRDGTKIAYSVTGDGSPLVLLQAPSLSHIELYPRLPGAAEYLRRIGDGRKLIRLDFRGHGMADRNIEDHSPEALTDDLEAVLDAVRSAPVDIVAAGVRVTPALELAVRRPEMVSRIVLADPFTVRKPGGDRPVPVGLQGLMETNWDLFLEVTVNRNSGRPIGYVKEVTSFVRRCMDQRNCVAEVKARRPDEDWLKARRIGVPVLVLEFADNVHLSPGLLEEFAGTFPNGRFIAIPEGSLPPPYGDADQYLQAVAEFLGAPSEADSESSTTVRRLTPREAQVLHLLAMGRTQPEIAAALVVSPSTISRHVVSLYAKIGAHRRAEAVTWAIRNGFG